MPSEDNPPVAENAGKYQQQKVRPQSFGKWMRPPKTSQQPMGEESAPAVEAVQLREENLVVVDKSVTVPILKEKPLSFVEMVAERQTPVSTWVGPPLDGVAQQPDADEPDPLPEYVYRPKVEQNDDEVYFPRERIAVVCPERKFLHPLFTWTHLGVPAPMQLRLPAKPTRLQSLALPYILAGQHALVRVVTDGKKRTDELLEMISITAALCVYEENLWYARESKSSAILHISRKREGTKPPIREEMRSHLESLGKEKLLDKNTVDCMELEAGESPELSQARNLRYIFVDDVPHLDRDAIAQIIDSMPLHCVLVINCVTHSGKGLLSSQSAHTLRKVTIAMDAQ